MSSVQASLHPIEIEDGNQQFPNESTQDTLDYIARAQWLRAALLGANDGLVSIASLMVGIGAVNKTTKAMLVSGLAGAVAGACSMAIGEFVSVYAQLDMELAQLKRDEALGYCGGKKYHLPSPTRAAMASALAFAFGAVLPLLAGGFIHPWWVRLVVVCGITSLGLAAFGAAGAVLGRAHVLKNTLRVLLGGWMAMFLTYGFLKLAGHFFGSQAVMPK